EERHAGPERHEMAREDPQIGRRPADVGAGDHGGHAVGLGEEPPGLGLHRALEEVATAAIRLAELLQRPPGGLRKAREPGRERGADLVEYALPLVCGGHGAVAADETDARSALVALVADDEDDADLGGRAGMGAAARLEVEALGLDQA